MNKNMWLRRWIVVLGATFSAVSLAQTPTAPQNSGGVVIDIANPKRGKYPIAVVPQVAGDPGIGQTVAQVATWDMNIAGWFSVVTDGKFPSSAKSEGLGFSAVAWKPSGAYGVMKFRSDNRGGNLTLDFKLFEVEKGDQPTLERSYQGKSGDARALTHRWCNEVVKYYTGEEGFFGSRLAFSAHEGRGKQAMRKIVAIDTDGQSAVGVSRNRSINILPAYSPSGGQIAYTSYMRGNADLYVASAGGGRPRRVSQYPGMNTGATWSPNGTEIAVTLSKDGNPDIYIISADSGAVVKRLTKDRAIDTSPSWSADGKEIAFVSDREGSPQIFIMNADGSNQRRVSMNGTYNTTPTWSPQKGARILAYTTRDESRYDIVTLDVNSGKMVRVTQNEGNNEEPAFAPNGRAIAFASKRPEGSGVYIANADGTGDAVMVWKGTATSVDWGPVPK